MQSYNTPQYGQKPLKQAEKIEDVSNYGIWHLGRREHSISELKNKLGRKTDNLEWIEKTIEQLIKLGYLNDKRFTENFLRDCNEFKKYGPVRIKKELKLKGVENDIINEVMQESEFDYFEAALEYLNNKYREPIKDKKDRDRITRFFLGKGYGFDIIRYAFSEHLKDTE